MQTIISKDGTKIAYGKTGNGPAVILVSGAMGTYVMFEKLAQLLSPGFTVYNYDRRGRGDSSDTLPYSVEKEIEDIDALINEAGGTAFIYGISSGACLALEAASVLGEKVKKLALYEAPYDDSEEGKQKWKEYTTKLKGLITSGTRSEAVVLFMKFVGVPDEMIAGMKNAPLWPGLEKTSPTLIYDAACMGEDRTVPINRAQKITANTLVMDGNESLHSMPFMHATAEALAKAVPNAKQQTLQGQSHNVDANVLAPALKEFFKQ